MEIPVADGKIKGYLAEPDGDGPHPGVVIIHDLLGLNQDTKAITDRFARAGYLALSPDLYSRGGAMRCIKSVFGDLTRGHGRVFEDVESARQVLASHAGSTGKTGVVGFCMGGGFALVAASGEFDASAPYYGFLPKDMSILDEACPIVGSFGKKDPALKGAARKLEAKLAERAIPYDIKEYPEAGHGFANKFNLGPLNLVLKVMGTFYHEPSAEDSFARVTKFFAHHLA